MQLDDDSREDVKDLELDQESPESLDSSYDFDRDRGGPNWALIWVGVLLLAAVVGVYFGFFRGRQQAAEAPAPEPPPASEAPAPAVVAEPEQEIELPALDASDAAVRELVSQLSEHPQLVRWLATEELVRKFAVAIDNIAEGKSPRQHLNVLAPSEDFAVADRDGQTVLAAASYRRYDAPARVLGSLDAAAVAKLYGTVAPLMAEAYRDLGYPNRDFDATMARAIGELVSTPIPEGDVVLLPKVSSYEFADPALEALSPAQKHLLRMGPENARTVQRKLAEIRDEIGLEP